MFVIGGCIEINIGGTGGQSRETTSRDRGGDVLNESYNRSVDDVLDEETTQPTQDEEATIEIGTVPEESTAGTEAHGATVPDVRSPVAEAVSVDQVPRQNQQDEFQVTIENTGISGDIGYTLVFMQEEEGNVYSIASEKIASRQRYFSSGERRTVSITAEPQEGYEGYGFRLWPAEVEADVRNQGPAGEIRIKLIGRDEEGGFGGIIEDMIIRMSEGEQRTVLFEGEYDGPFSQEITVEAERVE